VHLKRTRPAGLWGSVRARKQTRLGRWWGEEFELDAVGIAERDKEGA
jgi:hypothetical protein